MIYEISICKSFVWDTSQAPNCNSDLNYTSFTETLNKNRLSTVLYCCKTLSLSLLTERGYRNKYVFRKKSEPERGEYEENYTIRSFIICLYSHFIMMM